MLRKSDSGYGVMGLKFENVSVLPVHMASVSVIASKMSTDGFNSPSWIILVLSSWQLLHCKYTKVIIFRKIISRKLKILGEIFYVR